MSMQTFNAWGRVRRLDLESAPLVSRFDDLPLAGMSAATVLPFGNGRSYGDSCLNEGGGMLTCRTLNHFIHFDPYSGVLACEAGVLLSDILELVVPQGWFLPVTPGTRFVTVGGAIANDVHGKNHHVSGTFGRHVRRFELLRSDGGRWLCAPDWNAEWYAATIGGLGLTGVVTWAEIQLRRIPGPWINVDTIRFGSLSEFFTLCAESDQDYEYTVSWIDCTGAGKRLGRGLFMRGNHCEGAPDLPPYAAKAMTFPFAPPISMVNPLTLTVFNELYYHKSLRRLSRQIQHYQPFFYPLDGILEWNRMYGAPGFYQYQCVAPMQGGEAAIGEMLEAIAQSGLGSFLAVLKVCGDVVSPGMLSFPMPGVSLALDFPNCGDRLHELFARLDQVVAGVGGRLYPAKDGRMPASLFQSGYPAWRDFSAFIDPRFSSSFWRRVTELA